MTTPYYVGPEQVMKDRADYARKGIARGRSVIVMQVDCGILFVAENPSRALHKVSEIYDRIGFAAVGKYNEFELLRVAGIRLVDRVDRQEANAVNAERVDGDGCGDHGDGRGREGRSAGEGTGRGVNPAQLIRRKARQTLWPPNPKELDNTTFSVCSRAWLGTTSRSHAGSGFW